MGSEHVCTKGAVTIDRFDAQSVTLGFLSEPSALAFAKANSARDAKVEPNPLGPEE